MIDLNGILALSWNWRKSALLIQAHKTGLFDAMTNNWQSAEDVAGKLQTDHRATALVLLALSGVGLMEKSGDKYKHTEVTEKYLVSSSPDYIGAMLELDRRAMGNWTRIPEIIRTGEPIPKPETTEKEKVEWRKTYTDAMEALSRPKRDKVISALPIKEGDRFLDIGCGPGAYLIDVLRRFPNVEAVGFDLDVTGHSTRKNIAKAGLEKRAKFLAGDLLKDPIEGKFDVAFISQVLHIFSAEEVGGIIKKVVTAIKPGGVLAIQEMTVGPDKNPGDAALFAVQMMLGTKNGAVYTVDEMKGFLENAGLSIESVTAINDRDDVIVGRMPPR